MSALTLIVSHDAGAAEVIASWVKRQRNDQFHFALEGPAIKVFQRRLGTVDILPIDLALKNPSAYQNVVTGTSWSTNLERRVIRWAREKGIPSQTFLDHWINYRVRFLENGELILPDRLYVYDDMAKERAETELGHQDVHIVENPYWTDTLVEIQSRSQERPSREGFKILYCTQPIEAVAEKITGDRLGYHYTEFEAIERFVEYLRPAFHQVEEFRLRVHPAEVPSKYTKFLEMLNLPIHVQVSPHEDLTTDLAWANWVVGCDTMAMVLAVKADRRVSCSIPKGGKPLDLPLPQIERLFQ